MKGRIAVLASWALVSGCAIDPYAGAPGGSRQYVQQGDPSDEGQEVLPPLPTFPEAVSCEQAFGAGRCGTGAEVYSRASLVAPPQVASWYMPYDYSSYTGALTYGHLAPPAVYIPYVQYRHYVAPTSFTPYRAVTPVVVQRYHLVPVARREAMIRQGPSFYSHRQGPPVSPGRPAPAGMSAPVAAPVPPPGVTRPLAPGVAAPASNVGPVRPSSASPPPVRSNAAQPSSPAPSRPSKPKEKEK